MRVSGVSALERYETCYVARDGPTIPFSCAGRIAAERSRGLRILVLCVGFPQEDPEVLRAFDHLGADVLSWGNPWNDPLPPLSESLPSKERGSEAWDQKLAPFLEEVWRKARPKRVYLPLGVAGDGLDRGIHEVGLHVFTSLETRDLFLYEERPGALLQGAVRMRLAQIGASLPPAASKVAGSSLFGTVLSFERAPHLRERLPSWSERLRAATTLGREWLASRKWQPQRAFGPRLQPLFQEMTGAALGVPRLVPDLVSRRFGSERRLSALSLRYGRSLGHKEGIERYWLVLPGREALGAIAPGLPLPSEPSS
jgi:hypothetical protein